MLRGALLIWNEEDRERQRRAKQDLALELKEGRLRPVAEALVLSIHSVKSKKASDYAQGPSNRSDRTSLFDLDLIRKQTDKEKNYEQQI
ncbi:MAG TPA: hypothetical protein VK604_08405 [Bryobacteraceae bacterium]|nr:hypothetical protein [Bryobacteraceae bacterium]